MLFTYKLVAAFFVALLSSFAEAGTVEYNLTISWITANPDGFERTVIGINGQWPPPILYATKGDQIIANFYNDLKNESTTIHFHGMFQNGTTNMDGTAGVTQCVIPPGSWMTYNFTVIQSGTYWYHSHALGQYPDGLRAPFIIHDDTAPPFTYDEEVVITFSDWYHDLMHVLIPKFMNIGNPTGAEPIPDSNLMNDTQNLKLAVEPGKTYLIRMVNVGAFVSQYVWFEGHNVSIVEVDGVYTQPQDADMIYIAVAQRYSVLLTAKNTTNQNFPIVAAFDQTLLDTVPDSLNPNVTGWLVYDANADFPNATILDEFTDYDDFDLVPYDQQPALSDPDYTVTLTIAMIDLDDGNNYASLNDIVYRSPVVPTVLTALTTGGNATNATVYGTYTHPYILDQGQVIEIILNNNDTGKHPFHLHGHHFQIISRSDKNAGDFNATDAALPIPASPIKRDTVTIRPQGNLRIRFVADNPGVWLFHCHIEWHMISGLAATFIEAPLALQASLKTPDDQYAVCKAAGIPTAGNVVGNTVDVFDLKGQPSPPPPLPAGFTARGIVALVFSCLAAFLGIAVIIWYGNAKV